MTNQQIHDLINRLNNKETADSVFVRKISATVEIAKVWGNNEQGGDWFFIKNEQNKYVGALSSFNNFHWFILPKYRKFGYLTRALKSSILPYLFCEKECNLLFVSISKIHLNNEEYLNSRGVAINCGFKPVDDETKFELKKSQFDFSEANYSDDYSEISSERLKTIVSTATYAYRMLCRISEEPLVLAFEEYAKKYFQEDKNSYSLDEDLYDIRIYFVDTYLRKKANDMFVTKKIVRDIDSRINSESFQGLPNTVYCFLKIFRKLKDEFFMSYGDDNALTVFVDNLENYCNEFKTFIDSQK